MSKKHCHISLLLFVILTLSNVLSFGQCDASFPYLSDRGTFNISQIRGCAPLQVNICINNTAPGNCAGGGSGPSCDFDYGDGSDEDDDRFQHTYNEPGNYRLEIIYQNNSSGVSSDFIDIVITDNDAPNFEIFSCAGNTARVNIEDSQYDTYAIDFGDGTNAVVPISSPTQQHTYASGGTRTVTVQGIDINGLDNCPVASNEFNPLQTLPPTTIDQLRVLDDSSLELLYPTQENVLYRLEIQVNGSGNFNFIKEIGPNTSPDTIPNLDLVNNYYCFRIGTIDPCTNSVVYSNAVCSIALNLAIENANNALTWNTNNPSAEFNLAREVENENGSTGTNRFQTFNVNVRSYNDQDIFCNTQYCYFLEADFNGGLSISNEVCGIAESTNLPDPVTDLSIQIMGTESRLDWPESMAIIDNYEIQSFGTFLGRVEETNFTDFIGNRSRENACYTIVTTDDCENVNISNEICSIFLQGTIARDNTVSLSWNDYTGFENGINSYQVEKLFESNSQGTVTRQETTYEEVENTADQQVISYLVSATPANSTLDNAISNLITLIKPNNIYYPTGFTPNNDGNNDTFTVRGRFFSEYQLQIFNRWGEMIFSTDTPESGWDGTFNGQLQQEGTYIFNLEATDLAGREIQENGSFVLVRR